MKVRTEVEIVLLILLIYT